MGNICYEACGNCKNCSHYRYEADEERNSCFMDSDNKQLLANAKQRVTTLTYDCLVERPIVQIFTCLDAQEQETRYIHFFAYGYCSDEADGKDHRFLEYTWFIAPLQNVLNVGVNRYESEYSDGIKQYIEDCTEKTMVERYMHYNAGECPLPIPVSKLDMNVPDGTYVLLKG